MLGRDPKAPGDPLCEHRLATPKLAEEAHDVARLEEASNVFPQHLRVNGVLRDHMQRHG
jgi:hypothetical protein